MDYDEFKAEFLGALLESGVPTFSAPSESLDLKSLTRTLRVYVRPFRPEHAGPMRASGTIWWSWDALHAARTTTSEQEVLHQLLGTDDSSDTPTDRPYLRIDLELHAKFDWGKEIAMPPPATWARWAREVVGRLEEVERLISEETSVTLPNGRLGVLGWQGKPMLSVSCDETGNQHLEGVSVSAFQIIEVPRHSDNSDWVPDPHPAPRLRELFARVRRALQAWDEAMDHLVPATSGRPGADGRL
jgi:hypothetical protein